VAVVFSAAGRSQDFTNDRSRLHNAIDSLSAGYATHLRGWDTAADPRAPEDATLPIDMEARGPKMDTDAQWRRASMTTLTQVAETLIAAPQRRKALVFVSPGIAVDLASASMPMLTHAAAIASMKEANRDLARGMSDLYLRMQHANVTVYPVDPFGGGFEGWVLAAAARVPALRVMSEPLPAGFDYLDASSGFVPQPSDLAKHMSSLSLDFLQTSAANTGGFAVVNTNDFDDALDRMFLENSAYYLIGYSATPGHRPGSHRRIAVRVGRPGVMVRARSGYTTPKAAGSSNKPAPSPLDVAIEGPVPKGGFPMRIAVAPVAVPGRTEAAVTIALALEQAPVSRRTESLIDLQTNAYLPDGKPVLVGRRHSARVVLVPAGSREPARYELLTHIELKPGRYQLRLSAYRAADATDGSVFADVEIPDFGREPLSVSGAIVEVLPPMRSAPAGAFDTFLPVIPTTLREFTGEEGAVVFMRIYQGGRAPVASVTVRTRVLDASDKVVAEETQTLRPDRFYQPGRSTDYRFPLPLADVQPGKYAAIFEMTSGARSITRGIRFVVR
jgi:VWFA-related protein